MASQRFNNHYYSNVMLQECEPYDGEEWDDDCLLLLPHGESEEDGGKVRRGVCFLQERGKQRPSSCSCWKQKELQQINKLQDELLKYCEMMQEEEKVLQFEDYLRVIVEVEDKGGGWWTKSTVTVHQ